MQEEDQPHPARSEEAAGCAKTFGSCHQADRERPQGTPLLNRCVGTATGRRDSERNEKRETSPIRMSNQHPGRNQTALD